MKNIIIVFSHPESKSMNGMLKDKAVQILEKNGYQVKVRDLYDLDFPAAIVRSDYPFYEGELFDLQIAQEQAVNLNQTPSFIKAEQDMLEWADAIIFQFPLWWYSTPAILKSYIDNVFSVGFCYGGRYALEGKGYLLSFTTGAPKLAWTSEKKGTLDQLLFHLDIGTFQMVRMNKLQPFVGFGSKRLSWDERESVISNYGEHLLEVFL